MDSREELREYRAEAPWRIRVAGRGAAALLGEWRMHLDVLAIRGMWSPTRHIPAFVADAAELAGKHGFRRVLSPLLPARLLSPYHEAGMRTIAQIVAIQGMPGRMATVPPPPGVVLREAQPSDREAVARLDSLCFDEFWRYGAREVGVLLGREHCVLAETTEGEPIGYTLATVNGGSAVLSRLCTAPHAQRRGIGAYLLGDAAAWFRDKHASTVALCTQTDNAAARALYAAAGLVELDEPYAFAMMDAATGRR